MPFECVSKMQSSQRNFTCLNIDQKRQKSVFANIINILSRGAARGGGERSGRPHLGLIFPIKICKHVGKMRRSLPLSHPTSVLGPNFTQKFGNTLENMAIVVVVTHTPPPPCATKFLAVPLAPPHTHPWEFPGYAPGLVSYSLMMYSLVLMFVLSAN